MKLEPMTPDPTPEILEALDNTAASLETCMAHYGHLMPDADAREAILKEAQAVLAKYYRYALSDIGA